MNDRYIVALTGGFPRTRSYARVMSKYLKERVDRKTLYNDAKEQTLKIMKRLSAYGVSLLNDGMYLTDDIFNPFREDIENTETGWLVRFYENNNFVRNIIVKGPISLKEKTERFDERLALITEIRSSLESSSIFRLPVPGPLTFFEYSHIETNYTLQSFIKDYVEKILVPLAEKAWDEKVYLEIHEPALSTGALNIPHNYSTIMGTLEYDYFLKTYFGTPPDHIVRSLTDNVILGIDLVEGRKIKPRSNSVELGIIDSRNTRMEKIEKLVQKVSDYTRYSRTYFSTNTFLEFLPEKIAYRKMRLLCRLKRKLGGM